MESYEILSYNEPVNESKLKSFTVEEKLKLISEIENGRTVKDVSEEFGVNRNTLHYIFKNKNKFKDKEKCNPAVLSFKRIRDVKYPQLDQRILDLMYDYKNRGEKISGNVIKAVALETASELNFTEFSGSNGWLCSFLKRHKIKLSEFNEDHITSKTNNEDEQIETIEEPFEVVNNDEQSNEIVEEVLWECCRLCGSSESTENIPENLIFIVNSLLNKSFESFYICSPCEAEVNEISQVVNKWRATDQMFADLNEPTKQAIDSEIVEEIIEEETIPENYEEFVEENEISEEIIENESNIENFETSQSGVYDFKCHICNQQFSKMFELVNHTRVNHKTIPKVACECGKYLSTWESLVKHYKKHSNQEKPFTCHSCDKSFTTKTGLHIHQQHAHHKTQQELTCETCGKVFKDLQVLKNHKRTHLPDEEKFCFECEICGKKVINKFSLKYHIDNVHNGVKVCSCPICGKNFGHRSNLSSHMISHTNDKVECDICGKIFKNQISLRTHLKSFHNPNNKKLKCNECDKTFRTKSELSRHTRIHMDQQRNQDEYEVIVFECQTDQ